MDPRDFSSTRRPTQYDPDTVLDFFDSLGVFSELDTPRGSLLTGATDASTSLVPRRAVPFMEGSAPSSNGAAAAAVEPLAHLRSEGHFSHVEAFGAACPASPISYDTTQLLDDGYTRQCSPLSDATEELDEAQASDQSSQPAARRKQSKKIPSSQRQREKLVYLRCKVTALNNKLEAIKHESMVAVLNASDSTVPTSAVLWHALAQRQLAAKARAEAENAEIRAQLKAQLKYAKFLERVMQKRWIQVTPEENRRQYCEALSENESEIFKALRSSVDAHATRLDEILSAKGLTQESTSVRNESSFALGEENGVQVDFVNCKAALFEVSTIASVVWDQLIMAWSTTKNVGLITEVVDESSDVRLVKQSVAIPSDNGAEQELRVTTARIVCQRFVEEHRVRFVWEIRTESLGAKLRGMPPLQLVERGCSQVFQSSIASRSAGGGLGRRTVIQSVVSVIPDLSCLNSPSSPSHSTSRVEESKAEASSLQSRDIEALAQQIMSSFQENAESVRRVVENKLVDEMLNTHKVVST